MCKFYDCLTKFTIKRTLYGELHSKNSQIEDIGRLISLYRLGVILKFEIRYMYRAVRCKLFIFNYLKKIRTRGTAPTWLVPGRTLFERNLNCFGSAARNRAAGWCAFWARLSLNGCDLRLRLEGDEGCVLASALMGPGARRGLPSVSLH